jgi:hypothetical protein
MELPTADAPSPDLRAEPQALSRHRGDADRQRWAERLDRAERPVGVRDTLRDRLANLEPGHPSSPWDEHGMPRAPIPRLSDLERPKPSVSDAAEAAHDGVGTQR